MSKVAKFRANAFHAQDGRCFYCNKPMWLSQPADFAAENGLRRTAVRDLQATAEHLLAKCDGGTNVQSNIVAAHYRCNRRRHARPIALPHDEFQALVMRRIAQGRWHEEAVLRL